MIEYRADMQNAETPPLFVLMVISSRGQDFSIICRLDFINFSTKMQIFAIFLFYEKIDTENIA